MVDRPFKKFLGPEEIETAISEIDVSAKRANIDIALVGGAAMQVWGSDRLTKDVDFIATAVLMDVIPDRKLSFGGVAGKSPVEGIPVDIIVRNDDYQQLYEEALENSMNIPGIQVPVVSSEFLAAMKLAAHRAKDEEDLKTLLRIGELDLAKTRQIIRKHLGKYAVDDFDSYLSEVEWRKSRGEEP